MSKSLLLSLITTGLLISSASAKNINLTIGDVKTLKNDVSISTDYIIRANHSQCDNMYIYELNIAGIEKENISLNIIGNDILNIKIQRLLPKDTSKESYHLIENKFGTFERNFTLPFNADLTKLETSINNGILYITFPIIDKDKINNVKKINLN